MAAIMLILKCLTNLHVGNGDVNYNIVDNEVERDPLTNYPMINASGVKGALRVFLKDSPKRDQWFGSETQAGQLKILSAFMVARPMRTIQGTEPYKLVYTKEMKKQYEELSEVLGIKSILGKENAVKEKTIVEGYTLGQRSMLQMPDEELELYRMEHENFAACELPVIARNHLNNGKSENLWYEEVVPHKSIFYVPVVADDKELLESFKGAVDKKVIQFGGNASIGYGLCKVFAVGGIRA